MHNMENEQAIRKSLIVKALQVAAAEAAAIEDMKHNCDGEVYEAVAEVVDLLTTCLYESAETIRRTY